MQYKWQELQSEAQTAARKARELAERAEDQGRNMTETESREFDALHGEAVAKRDRSQRAKADRERVDAINGLDSPEAFRARQGGSVKRGLPLPTDMGESDRKALHGMVTGKTSGRVKLKADDNVLTDVAGTRVEGFAAGRYVDQRRLASLFGQQTTDSPTVRIYRAKKLAEAGLVSEGEKKPDAGLEVEPVDVEMQKVAVVAKISDEAAEDYRDFVSFVGNELTASVLGRENKLMVDDLLDADLDTAEDSGGDGVDAVADAIATLASAGVTADGVAMSPKRLATVRKAKADGSGNYLVVPPTDDGPSKLHGLPIVTVPHLGDDTVLVGEFANAGTLWVRSNVSIDANTSEDDFIRNVSTLRAEERLRLGVTSPKRVVNIDLSGS